MESEQMTVHKFDHKIQLTILKEKTMHALKQLIKHLEVSRVLYSEAIKEALTCVDRSGFVRDDLQRFAYDDSALPIAEGQTISQPTTVVFMLELLDVKKGQTVCDIGAGSGWVSCLIGLLVGKKGHVYAYERNKTVGEIGKENVEKNGAENVTYAIGNAAKLWHKHAPYDRIYSGAAFETIPKDLLQQLAIGGILVTPTQDGNIRTISRQGENDFVENAYYGFTFVPFVE
ncbi:MAG: protein-L-isoaspartate O-methyltransferase [Patescibacteria group bacterium]|nr:protein-L-isoaspartate O-methyltransferase [Patescibacteria group bacterium]